MLGLKPRATSCGTNSSLKYFLVTCTISLIRHLLCTVAPLLSVSTILHFVFWRELNPYGAGWICTVRLVWPRINSRWHENLKVLFPATDARSTLSQMFISLFFFFFPHFICFSCPHPLFSVTQQRMKPGWPVLGSGKGCIRSQESESRKAQTFIVWVPTWLWGATRASGMPHANTSAELIAPVIIYCRLHLCSLKLTISFE